MWKCRGISRKVRPNCPREGCGRMWAVEDTDLELRREASRREAVLAVEPDEVCARDEASPLEHAASFREEDDLVDAAEADRLDETAALCELLDQRYRNLRERGRDEDCVVRRVLREPGAAGADDDGRVVDAVALEMHASGAGDVLPALDAPDLAGEVSEHGGLPAEAGADLEHPVGGRK